MFYRNYYRSLNFVFLKLNLFDVFSVFQKTGTKFVLYNSQKNSF